MTAECSGFTLHSPEQGKRAHGEDNYPCGGGIGESTVFLLSVVNSVICRDPERVANNQNGENE